MFPGLFLTSILNQSIILTLVGESYCYSHNPDRQGENPLLPVLKKLVCRGQESNSRPPAHEADALTNRPPRWSIMLSTQPQTNPRSLNSLPNDKTLDVTKLKAFADDKINVTQMMIPVFDRVENIVGKGENAGNQHFLLFPQCFQKASFLGSLKVGIVW